MKKFIFASLLALSACGKSKTVAVPAPGGPAVETPAAELPPIENPGDGVIQWDEVEDAVFNDILDLKKVSTADQKNTVYLSAANFQNFGDDVNVAKQGALLGLNMLSNGSFIKSIRPLEDMPSVFAVKLQDFLGANGNAIWKTIEDTAVLKIESQTARGQNLKVITGKKIPIMHLQVFLETAFIPKNYYAIKGTPADEATFFAQKGIDRQADFDARDSDITLIGMQVSLIAPGHNRLIRRFDGDNGPCWETFDIDSLQLADPVFAAKANFFLNPFPVEARSVNKSFLYSANEKLCRQKNGLFSVSLWNAAGVRQEFAPPTVVTNTRTASLGLEALITLRDCVACHTSFILPARDEIRRQVQDNPFSAADKVLAQLFFKPQAETDRVIAQDNADHSAALTLMNIQQGGSDPMNVGVIDKMRDGYTARELAAFLYMSEGDFLTALAGSQAASNEVGQLASGGTLGFFQLQGSIQTLIADLNLFRDLD